MGPLQKQLAYPRLRQGLLLLLLLLGLLLILLQIASLKPIGMFTSSKATFPRFRLRLSEKFQLRLRGLRKKQKQKAKQRVAPVPMSLTEHSESTSPTVDLRMRVGLVRLRFGSPFPLASGYNSCGLFDFATQLGLRVSAEPRLR
eukprot:g42172.t1